MLMQGGGRAIHDKELDVGIKKVRWLSSLTGVSLQVPLDALKKKEKKGLGQASQAGVGTGLQVPLYALAELGEREAGCRGHAVWGSSEDPM